MDKSTLNRVRLEERAKILLKASEEVSDMLHELAVSDKSETKGKPDNQKKKQKANQNERRSHSLTNLNAEKIGQPARGGYRGRGQRGRGKVQQQPIQNRSLSGQCRPTRGFPPSYDEAVVGTRQFNQHQPNPRQHFPLMPNPPQHFPLMPNPPQHFPLMPNPPPLFPIQQLYQGRHTFAPNMPITQDAPSNVKNQFHPPPSLPLSPFSPESPSKKIVQGSTKVLLVDIYHLIEQLVSFSGFFTDVEKLSKLLDRNYDVVLKVIKEKSKVFSTLEDKGSKKVMVELCPAVKICEYHLGPSGCLKSGCFFIHICSDYVVGTCHKKNCPFGHSWKSNHNDFILRNFCIDKIPVNILHKLMEKVFNGTIVPKICYQYHQQNCEIGIQCNDLHICYSYVKTLGDCSSGASCPYNHNVRDPRCKAVLEKFGICMNESPRDLLKIISSRPNCFHKFEGNEDRTTTSASKKNKVEKEQKEINEDNQEKKLQTEEDDKKINRKKGDKKPSEAKAIGTVYSWEFRGNVDTPSICYMNLFGKCAYVEKGCKYLHAKTTYHWQFGNDKWYNFHKTHSEILESNFRDVTCDETVLPELDRDKINDEMKDLFSLLGTKTVKVDFRQMTIDCESSKKAFSIRHLITASSAVHSSKYNTTFNWYFDAGNEKWELFGGSSEFSKLIEKVYQEDPTSIFNIAMNNSGYELDFSMMTQQNKKTMMMRKIKRRPAPFPAKDQISVKKKKFELPQNWESMDDSDPYRLVILDNESSEYKDIRQIIQLTLPMSNIIGISRVQNIQLWEKFKNKESEIERKYGDSCLNVQKLFHGIDDQFLVDICRDNLNWQQFQEDIVRWYGNGAYFYNSAAEAAHRCRNYSKDSKNLLVAEVIIGKLTEGDGSMMKPPENPDLNTLFDTTTDSVTSPTVFVKYDKQEFYPAYIVEFS